MEEFQDRIEPGGGDKSGDTQGGTTPLQLTGVALLVNFAVPPLPAYASNTVRLVNGPQKVLLEIIAFWVQGPIATALDQAPWPTLSHTLLSTSVPLPHGSMQ
jgi:hypothetical protein